jgi:serine/threonine protein kinase
LVRKWDCAVGDVYLLDRKLGEGSFGTVFLVTHKQLKVQRALKVINKKSRSSSNPVDELELLKKLDHPNIIKIYEYYETKEKWYIVTEYFEGR